VKIGLKFLSLGKISNISAADPPLLLGQFQHCFSPKIFALKTVSKWLFSVLGMCCSVRMKILTRIIEQIVLHQEICSCICCL